MRSRADWEAFESGHLAPYACRSSDTRGRTHPDREPAYRSAFQRDRDRIVHCTAFRRLEYKTQVFVNHEGDHYRTRLTHTLEVAQIARTLARALGLNEDLVEAIALAHDLGHGPFGHASEHELDRLMAGHGGFDHNREGLRVVDVLEQAHADFPGLNLTAEVREGFCKNCPQQGAPHIPAAPNVHLEAQLVALADSIAYDNHDIDDGIASGLLDSDALANEIPLWADALASAEQEFRGAPDAADRSRLAPRDLRRRIAIRRLIGRMATDIIEESERAIADAGVQSPDDARACADTLIRPSAALADQKQSLEAYLYDNFYHHHRVNRVTRKSQRFVRALFDEFVQNPGQLLSPRWRALAARERQEHGKDREGALRRVVCDYIAGMTDRYAQEQYRRLFEPFEKM